MEIEEQKENQSQNKKEKNITCILCPNSCLLRVWINPVNNNLEVEGFLCPKGKEYGKKEFTDPQRLLITTMCIKDGILPVIPVRTRNEVPKDQILTLIKIVNKSICQAPIKMGQILIENIGGINTDLIASRNMEKKR